MIKVWSSASHPGKELQVTVTEEFSLWKAINYQNLSDSQRGVQPLEVRQLSVSDSYSGVQSLEGHQQPLQERTKGNSHIFVNSIISLLIHADRKLFF